MKSPNWMTLLILSIPAVVLLVTNLQEAGILTATIAQLLITLFLAIKKYLEESATKTAVHEFEAEIMHLPMPDSFWTRVWKQ